MPGRIVVFVDDTDRLLQQRSATCCRLVRLTGSSPNGVYVLCLDRAGSADGAGGRGGQRTRLPRACLWVHGEAGALGESAGLERFHAAT
ncbi:P-loop NTPase fold protein [Streptomyces sp. Tu102]|uniref:P-loop NTPase fold protein n=1 Tax=Streptomyces TaxID=1883 RepID=UPI0027E54588|nr:P-loop NTPase fold protein [Streptomyces sp. Tu102]